MTKGINYAYQEVENTLVNRINSAGLPLFAVRDLLNRILLQVDKQMTDQVEAEKKAYFDGLKREQEEKAKAAQVSADQDVAAASAKTDSPKKEAKNA